MWWLWWELGRRTTNYHHHHHHRSCLYRHLKVITEAWTTLDLHCEHAVDLVLKMITLFFYDTILRWRFNACPTADRSATNLIYHTDKTELWLLLIPKMTRIITSSPSRRQMKLQSSSLRSSPLTLRLQVLLLMTCLQWEKITLGRCDVYS